MADHISFHMVTGPTQVELLALARSQDGATKAGLRAVAARVRRESRSLAPVYSGPRTTVSVGGGKQVPLIPGELKKGIRASRAFKRYPNSTFGLSVGPRGGHVHLYAAKQERRTPYMAPGHDAAMAEANAILEAAWAKSLARGRR